MLILQWVDATGKRTPLTSRRGNYLAPRLTPDGMRLAVTVRGSGGSDIELYDIQRDTWTNLTAGAGRPFFTAAWTPDGEFVVFGSMTGMFWARSHGTGQPQQLVDKPVVQLPWSITCDEKRLAFVEVGAANAGQIWTVPLKNARGQLQAGTSEPFFKTAFSDVEPAFSPDGKWLAYASNSSGAPEVYVRKSANGEGPWKISDNGGEIPIWSPHGRDLLYQKDDVEMAVSYAVERGAFVPKAPRVWVAHLGGQAYDISPHGRRLVVLAAADPADGPRSGGETGHFMGLLDELRRKMAP